MSTSRSAVVLHAPEALERGAVDLEEYYSEAGPDYSAWSRGFNMHFGFCRWGMNPLDREGMLEQMNVEVQGRLGIDPAKQCKILDMGCGLGATLRTLAGRLPHALLTGVTRVPCQVEEARARNASAEGGDRIHVEQMDYEHTALPSGSFDAAYALESACHAHGADKAAFLKEAHRLLRPGGRLVMVDAFLHRNQQVHALQRRICKKLCECWVIESWGDLHRVIAEMRRTGFHDIEVESWHWRVTPSVCHIPWVTLKFLVRDVCCDRKPMTRARWNNMVAPMLAPLVSMPLGPLEYCMVSAMKR
jgi:SAM-dependent methyltransferase